MFFFFLFLLFGELFSSAICCPAGCYCPADEVVQCGRNVTDVPSLVSPKTILLRLVGTQITELGKQSFRDLPALLGLDISHSLLRTVNAAAFGQLPRLRSLKMSFTKLSSLPGQVFSNLTSLKQLFLSGNELETIPQGLFDALVKLTLLDLSSNHLVYLDRNVFQNLKNLDELDLGKNSLTELPVSVFSPLTRLRYLRLYFNNLESLHPGTFDNITDLLELDLFSNNISQLSPCLFWNLSNLEKLSLSRNKLQTIPDQSFYYLPRMSFLSLYINPLTFLPDRLIGHMPRLKEFYLYETELDTLPENLFCNMTTLKILSVSFNRRLQHLPKDIFSCLSSLYRLKLEANHLQFLHRDLFSGLVNLETLILNSNKLHSLPSDIFRDVPRLANISLENNLLETLPGEVLSVAAMLRKVTLKDNPWKCSCDILDFAEWVSRMRSVIKDFEHVLCHAPPNLQNISLGTLSSELDPCSVTTTVDFTVGSHTSSIQQAFHPEDTPIPEFVPFEETAHHILPRQYDITEGATREAPSQSNTAMLPHTATKECHHEGIPSNESPAFYEAVILEPEDRIVHNNRLNGWVYLWTLPPSGPYIIFLVVFHVLLVATGMVLIVGSICVLYRLNQAMEHVANVTVHGKIRNASRRKQRFSDKI